VIEVRGGVALCCKKIFMTRTDVQRKKSGDDDTYLSNIADAANVFLTGSVF
jgi:hypothetical protein